jgi:hypothetical protein
VQPRRRAQPQQFLDHDVALERVTLVPTVFLGPGHPEQAGGTQRARELRIEAEPAVGALLDSPAMFVLSDQRANLLAQGADVSGRGEFARGEDLHRGVLAQSRGAVQARP